VAWPSACPIVLAARHRPPADKQPLAARVSPANCNLLEPTHLPPTPHTRAMRLFLVLEPKRRAAAAQAPQLRPNRSRPRLYPYLPSFFIQQLRASTNQTSPPVKRSCTQLQSKKQTSSLPSQPLVVEASTTGTLLSLFLFICR